MNKPIAPFTVPDKFGTHPYPTSPVNTELIFGYI